MDVTATNLVERMQELAVQMSTVDPKLRPPLREEYMELAQQLDSSILMTEIRASHEQIAELQLSKQRSEALREKVERLKLLHERNAEDAADTAQKSGSDKDLKRFYVRTHQIHRQFAGALASLLEE